MAKRGRPRSPRAASARIINLKLRLYPGEDDDLIVFFASVPGRLGATMVKQTLRSGIQPDSDDVALDEDEPFDALDALVD